MSDSMIFASALSSLKTSLDNFKQSASRLAGADAALASDLPEKVVDLIVDQRSVEASMVAVKAEDEMIGSILDILR